MAIHFYKEKGPYGYLASYAPYGFVKDALYWKTTEHYYQAQKFRDTDLRIKIALAETPHLASELGRNPLFKIRDNWDIIRSDKMFEAVYLKFRVNYEIAVLLVETQNEIIIEDTVKENYWGCGPNGDGENRYGKILCEVREIIKYQLNGGKYGENLYY